MNREDIIRMYVKANGWSPEGFDNTVKELERFANLVAAAEREACAQILLSTDLGGLKGDIPMQNLIANLLVNYAAAIRARGQS
jgi:hypothetical protein